MRLRRIIGVLAALLALAAGSAVATPRTSIYSTNVACVRVLSDRAQAQVRPGRIEVAEPALTHFAAPRLRIAAWADAAVRFQLPPPACA